MSQYKCSHCGVITNLPILCSKCGAEYMTVSNREMQSRITELASKFLDSDCSEEEFAKLREDVVEVLKETLPNWDLEIVAMYNPIDKQLVFMGVKPKDNEEVKV